MLQVPKGLQFPASQQTPEVGLEELAAEMREEEDEGQSQGYWRQ